jgi:heat shock protein HslJ
LEALNGVSVSPDDFVKGLPSLRFDQKGKLSGSTGCNQFNGDFELDGSNINLNPGAMTKMNCPGDGESKFLDALKGVSELNFEGDKLVLADQAKELLRFAPKMKNE